LIGSSIEDHATSHIPATSNTPSARTSPPRSLAIIRQGPHSETVTLVLFDAVDALLLCGACDQHGDECERPTEEGERRPAVAVPLAIVSHQADHQGREAHDEKDHQCGRFSLLESRYLAFRTFHGRRHL
jgi:hypothetical protein